MQCFASKDADRAAAVMSQMIIFDANIEQFMLPRLGLKMDTDSLRRNRERVEKWTWQFAAVGGTPYEPPPELEVENTGRAPPEEYTDHSFSVNDWLSAFYVRWEGDDFISFVRCEMHFVLLFCVLCIPQNS